MSTKFVLNETSYFGKGAREELAGEIIKRGFKKVFLVSDKALLEAGVTAKVEEVLKGDELILKLKVAQDDMGKVIGKQGRIAKAMRTVLKSASNRDNKKVTLEIM